MIVFEHIDIRKGIVSIRKMNVINRLDPSHRCGLYIFESRKSIQFRKHLIFFD